MLRDAPILKVPTIKVAIESKKEENGIVYLKSLIELKKPSNRITERLIFWAETTPDHVFLAQKDDNGFWKKHTYAEVWVQVQIIAQYLLNNKVGPNNPIAILSGNSLEHALISLAAMHVGIPYAPINPAYALRSTDYLKLRHCIDILSPGLIFVQDGLAFDEAIRNVAPNLPVMAVMNHSENSISLDSVLETEVTTAVLAAFNAIGPTTIAKILFTSGSTGKPKGVINTHRNITTNWQQITQTFPFIENGGLTLIDWLPWNHTFGGNHNFGLTLFNGGSLYIDEGNPTSEGVPFTVQNLRTIAPTVYFNVPRGFEELIPYLKEDAELGKMFFSQLKMCFYAGASMPQHVYDELVALSIKTTGKRILISSGLGMTEASPSALFNTEYYSCSGRVGVPVPGLEVKLVPDGDRIEVRFRGDNITSGYWRDPIASAKVFDEEGYYKTGDAVKFVDVEIPNEGLIFDGRLEEDFKLDSGTWASVGALREKLIKAGNGLIKDAVITGHDRSFLGAIIFLDLVYCAKFVGSDKNLNLETLHNANELVDALQQLMDHMAEQDTGSSTTIRRVVLADFVPSSEKGEITDKGSLNQKAILWQRQTVVQKIYHQKLLPGVLEAKTKTW